MVSHHKLFTAAGFGVWKSRHGQTTRVRQLPPCLSLGRLTALIAVRISVHRRIGPRMNSGGAKRKSCEGSAHFTGQILIQTQVQTVRMETLSHRGVWEPRQSGHRPRIAQCFICQTVVLPAEEIPV